MWFPIDLPTEDNKGDGGKSAKPTVELANEGRRLAVASSNSITIYDITILDTALPTWTKKSQIQASYSDVDNGRLMSMSSDGRFLATQWSLNQVKVWEIGSVDFQRNNSTQYTNDLNSTALQVGGDGVWILCEEGISSLKLEQVKSSLYMAVGCESYLYSRGKVHTFDLSLEESSSSYDTWQTFLPSLKGRNSGDMFGATIAVVGAPSDHSNRVFRLSVGSPGYNFRQGLAQVFDAIDDGTGWVQIGDDLTGSSLGEQFGTSLDLSAGEQPFLVVGSLWWTDPEDHSKSKPTSGNVQLYHWRSKYFENPWSSKEWALVDNSQLAKIGDDNEFGRTVVISRDGNRIAILSQRHLAVFERQSFNSVGRLVNDMIYTNNDEIDGSWGRAVALSRHGSLLATLTANGSIRTFLDTSGFCVVPRGSLAAEQTNVLESFLERQTCRFKDEILDTKETCSQAVRYLGGTWEQCSWEDNLSLTTHPTANPSSVPSLLPSMQPSYFPVHETEFPTTLSPSMQPSFDLSSQDSAIVSSHFPTWDSTTTSAPSLRPSLRAYSPNPSAVPTTKTNPLGLRSESPSVFPSHYPTRTSPSSSYGYRIFACHCDEYNRCTDQPLQEKNAMLRICVLSSSSDIRLWSSALVQSDFFFSLVAGGEPINDETTVKCDATQGRCVLQTLVSHAFFGIGRPNGIVVHGQALDNNNFSHEFSIKIETSLYYTKGNNEDSNVPSRNSGFSVGAFWTILIICSALLFLALVRVWKKRVQTSRTNS
jgi:hypothetical protein